MTLLFSVKAYYRPKKYGEKTGIIDFLYRGIKE